MSDVIVRRCAALPVIMILTALLAGTVLAGCVYRPNIQQGNLLKTSDVDQVTAGMTRSQVRYLLGTPMIADPFDPQRWDYVYTLKRGHSSKIDRAHFVVRFDGDKVSTVERLVMPGVHPDMADGKKSKAKPSETSTEPATREPPPLPSIEHPQPEAPRPGSEGTH